MHVYLVACVASKRGEISHARDLYTSAWFRKARAYVEGQKAPWFILSAKYGLLAPGTAVRPYELSLVAMDRQGRQEWAEGVGAAIGKLQRTEPWHRVTILAGLRYREGIGPALDRLRIPYDVPMEGLSIGRQLQWLDNAAGGASNRGFF